MCMGSTPKAPTPAAQAPAAAVAPESPTGGGTAARDSKRRAAASGTGSASTILTGPRGVQDTASTAKKTLLGA